MRARESGVELVKAILSGCSFESSLSPDVYAYPSLSTSFLSRGFVSKVDISHVYLWGFKGVCLSSSPRELVTGIYEALQ